MVKVAVGDQVEVNASTMMSKENLSIRKMGKETLHNYIMYIDCFTFLHK